MQELLVAPALFLFLGSVRHKRRDFGRGQMVREFDEVVFSGEVGKVLGPVQTQFGYHLIEVTRRTE